MKLGYLPFIALGLQLFIVFAGLGEFAVLRRFLYPLSFLPLLPFAWVNRRYIGIVIIGLGLALNFAAVASNGGLMPLDPETVARAGRLDDIARVDVGDAVPLSRNVLLERESTRLWWLTDRLVVDNPFGVRAFSGGDVVVGGGLLVALIELLAVARKQLKRPTAVEPVGVGDAPGGNPGEGSLR